MMRFRYIRKHPAAFSIITIALLVALIAATGIVRTFLSQKPTTRATVLFGGDMMFDRSVRDAINKQGGDFVFSCIDPTLQGADLIVANLEGPITANASISEGSQVADSNNFTFTFPLSTAALLYAHDVRMVNLGNNHIENFERAGVVSTINALSAAHVGYFGDPLSQTVATSSVKGIALAFVNFNQFADSSTSDKTIEQIRAERATGALVFVYTHWGEEYLPATEYEKTLAHEFIDAGADMVIGSHPHVVQEHELYKGKYIYYSLGNFIFDQYWNNAVRDGLLLSVAISDSGVQSVREIPVELEHDRRTCPLN